MTEGYIKLYRTLLDNPIHKKSDYFHLWVTLLLKANHKPNYKLFKNEKVILQPGQFPTGRKSLSAETGISESQVYKILNYLEKEHQIKQQKNNKFTIVTILNWNKFQGDGTTKEQQNEQPSNNQVTTTEQQSNTYKNDKNVKNDKKNIYAEFVSMTLEEYQKLIDKYGEGNTKKFIDKLNIAKGAKGYKYKSDYLAILNWVVEAVIGVDKKKELEDHYKLAIQKEKEWEKEKKETMATLVSPEIDNKIRGIFKDLPYKS